MRPYKNKSARAIRLNANAPPQTAIVNSCSGIKVAESVQTITVVTPKEMTPNTKLLNLFITGDLLGKDHLVITHKA